MTVEVRDPFLKLAARLDRQRDVIQPDTQLRKVSILAGLMLDQTENKTRRRMHQVNLSRGLAIVAVLLRKFQPLHAEYLLVPAAAAVSVGHGEFDVRHAG